MLHGPCAGAEAIEIAYQPIVDLVRGVVVGYEALSRFPEPQRSPLPWFELARDLGFHDELEAAALSQALAARDALPPNTFLAVNLGPDVLASPRVAEVWRAQDSLAGLVVELTENIRVESFTTLQPVLDELRSHGALLAIDDAGAGYAGLQHLLALRPDVVKLDRSLVEGIDRDEAKRALVSMMGTFAGRLDAWLLAEGVETTGELDALTSLGVPLAQGFRLGVPGPTFTQLPDDLGIELRSRLRIHGSETLHPFLERVPVARVGEAPIEGGVTGTPLEAADLVVVVDEHRRPVAVTDGAGTLRAVRENVLRISVHTCVRDAARRAIVRPAATRFLPLVCIDDAGRYVGVVRMERLVDHLCHDEDAED